MDLDLPDCDLTVMIFDTCEEVALGFFDGEDGWRYCSADRVTEPVTHWAHLPAGPNHEIDQPRVDLHRINKTRNHQKTPI